MSNRICFTDTQGWVFYKDGSVNGSRYVTIHKPMTFYGAQDACRDQGGHLAHINNIREQVFVEEYLKQIVSRNSKSYMSKVIIPRLSFGQISTLFLGVAAFRLAHTFWFWVQPQNLKST